MKKYKDIRSERYSYLNEKFPSLFKITSPYSWLKSIFYCEASAILVCMLLKTRIKPNTITAIYGILGIVGCIFMSVPNNNYIIIGLIIAFTKGILDWSDGQYARIIKETSITGHILDIYGAYLNSLGFQVIVEKDYGSHLGFNDEEYKSCGAQIVLDKKDVFDKSDLILQLHLPSEDSLSFIKDKKTLIGSFNYYQNKERLIQLSKKKINIFSLELLPRITRAQSMDILSSQANLAGYKAVLESFANFSKAIPMMMTAAGTIPAAKVLVVGAGVAGLQAIATAKRMGAIVFATDVRIASKEQVESLGGKFLIVDGSENMETKDGYAKETSEEFKKRQEELLIETLKKIDIVICTALIPGKKAPVIIKEEMINNMQAGSVIYDLAAVQGGNSACTKLDKIVEKNGVKILGETNILNKLPTSASNLYAKNLFNFVSNLYDKKNNKININLEDEIISKTLIK